MSVAAAAEAWTVQEVSEWLASIELPQYRPAFEGNAIDGRRLVTRVAETKQLISLGVRDHADQLKLLAAVKELRIACGLEPRYRVPQGLTNNECVLTPAELALCRSLCLEAGQAHLFERWPAPGIDDEGKRTLADQLVALDRQYPAGGLLQYPLRTMEMEHVYVNIHVQFAYMLHGAGITATPSLCLRARKPA